jgi:hypothetical protein
MKKTLLTITTFLFCMVVFGQAKKPTIMVVPSDVWCVQNHFTTTYDNQGVQETIPDYYRALQNDANLLLAIGKINSMMTDRGFPLKDLQTVTKSVNQKNAEDNMIQSKTSGASLAENPIDRLRRVSKADIIMQLTYTLNVMGPKYSVTYNLQGLDAYTNKQIAGAQGTGKQTFTAELPVLLEEAVVNNMDNFCDQLMAYFEDLQENGREVTVDIRVFDNGSGLDLETEFGGMELSEIIDDWMSDNTVSHVFNKSDGSETFIQYEQVRIPLYKTNGQQMDTESFVRELRKFLRDKYKIESKVMTRGLGRCILAIGEK